MHDPDVADDLTATVFESALTKLSSYRPARAPFGAWLFGIARHSVTDHFRATRRRRWLSLDIVRERAGDGPDPEHQAIDAEARGGPPYEPRLLLKVLLYGHASGVRSSRRLERHCVEDVAFRFLAANQQPDFSSIARFRQRHLAALEELFVQTVRVWPRRGW